MTVKEIKESLERCLHSSSLFKLEVERHRSGMSLQFSGIIGINDFSDSCIELKSHSGKIKISGKRLNVTLFENSNLEIFGRVEEIGFSYGKN